MVRVGITGGIGSGKTTVCKLFESLGVPVFYADEVSKQITSEKLVREEIKEAFGEEMYDRNDLQRQKLASIVFNDDNKLKKLNEIIHPAVGKAYESWLSAHQKSKYTLKEAAILFESGSDKGLDKIIVVTAPKDLRIERVMKRDGVEAVDVERRMAKQWEEDRLVERSDFRITNDGNTSLKKQVDDIHQKIMSL